MTCTVAAEQPPHYRILTRRRRHMTPFPSHCNSLVPTKSELFHFFSSLEWPRVNTIFFFFPLSLSRLVPPLVSQARHFSVSTFLSVVVFPQVQQSSTYVAPDPHTRLRLSETSSSPSCGVNAKPPPPHIAYPRYPPQRAKLSPRLFPPG